ncbi:MAG TPA: class I SAM-dependent methyltransferase [Deltaproteobacteria bacterium]|nr:class I SAM-dependent methyltransferase [Deltaproteobacteria bacterium]
MAEKIYPDSGVELTTTLAKHYDRVLNIGSLGLYAGFIRKAIREMRINPEDHILDLGCGTGRNARLMTRFLNERGKVTGLDISDHMGKHFLRTFQNDRRAEFIRTRIDQRFDLGISVDKVFISFVIHGFPHDVRDIIIQNAYRHLKPGGTFHILDYAEFNLDTIPVHHRLIFKTFECKYAFDFVSRDWKKILRGHGFEEFTEWFHFRGYVRLLSARKSRE